MDILFVSSVAIITPDPVRSRKLFVDALHLPLEPTGGDQDYYSSEHIGGSKHFGVWPLAQAAQSCFATDSWPADRPVPQFSIEFEVANEALVADAATELEAQGYKLLHPSRTEPWGQTVARIQTDEGVIVGISFAPWMHNRTASAD